VKKLRAARTLLVTESGETERQYWKLAIGEPRRITLAAATDEFERCSTRPCAAAS